MLDNIFLARPSISGHSFPCPVSFKSGFKKFKSVLQIHRNTDVTSCSNPKEKASYGLSQDASIPYSEIYFFKKLEEGVNLRK